MRTLVSYVFHEYHERVEYFIKNAIFLDPDIDFLVINNGCSIDPVLPDHVIYFKGQNIGYDFGGWSRGILYNDLYKDYDNFIFVNSSVMGPYLPCYFKGRWTDIYLDGLTDSIKLFGSTINTVSINIANDPENCAHVQSYIFSVNLEALELLISKGIFSLSSFSKTLADAVINKEVKRTVKVWAIQEAGRTKSRNLPHPAKTRTANRSVAHGKLRRPQFGSSKALTPPTKTTSSVAQTTYVNNKKRRKPHTVALIRKQQDTPWVSSWTENEDGGVAPLFCYMESIFPPNLSSTCSLVLCGIYG